jgi:hypothetical protein
MMSGIPIVTICLLCFDSANWTGFIQQKETATGNATVTLWQRHWILQYLSECLSVVYVLSTETDRHLGSCGSRMLEHFIGDCRRLCASDDCGTKFRVTLVDVLMEKIISRDLGSQSSQQQRCITERSLSRIGEKVRRLSHTRSQNTNQRRPVWHRAVCRALESLQLRFIRYLLPANLRQPSTRSHKPLFTSIATISNSSGIHFGQMKMLGNVSSVPGFG